MGAMAPPPHWIPEDDVLLKNAVEAGASLESLARGAVQFSRRYTVNELQDRWSSLLYDPVVSEAASLHMIEVERSCVINQLRPNKLEGVNNIARSSMKRKAESVRNYYYVMRKRICSEPLDVMGFNLVPRHDYSNIRGCNDFTSADCRINNPASDTLGAQGPDHSIRPHSFPEIGPHAAESTVDGVTTSFGGVQNNGQEDLGGENASYNLSFPYEENIALTGECCDISGFIQSKDLPLCDLFEAEGTINQASGCAEFGDQSFHSFECPPSLPDMTIWDCSQDISAAALPIEIADTGMQLRDEFMIPQPANVSDALGDCCDPSNPKLETPISCNSTIDMTSSTQEYLDVLFDLSNDEGLLYMDNEGKEAIEKSYLDGLSSLLLDSPNQCDMSGSGLGEAVLAADGHLVDKSDTHNEGPCIKDLCDQQEVADAYVSAYGSTIKVGPEYRNGVICCALNTEDTEIPSNDDVFLPFRFPSPTNSSGAHWTLHDHSYLGSSAVKNFSSTCAANGRPFVMKNTQKDSSVPSGRIGSVTPTDVSLRCRRDQGVKFELPESSINHAAFREAWSGECSNHASLANGNTNNFVTASVKGVPVETGQGKSMGSTSVGPWPDKHESSFNIHHNLQSNSIGSRSGVEGIAVLQNNRSSNARLSFQKTGVQEAVDQSLLSDQEELLSENEFDVPYFSDVEAMILDMDLSPDEIDLYTNPEVKQYQLEETKITIIRLEQAVHASTQRAIAAQDAFAALFGRYTKYFIKKTEVLLGRATDDIKVDIDMGRGKNGSKISRRQATLKMDMSGIFHLKNLGKYPIYMNGTEVAPGQSVSLISGCVIEIRELSFLFETNHKMIKQYVGSSAGVLADHKPLTRC